MNKKYISLHGAYRTDNYGDILILAIQAKWIKDISGKDVVLPFSNENFRKTINTPMIRGFEALKNSDKIVYGAGGYFGEPLTHRWKWGFQFFKTLHFIPAEYAILKKLKYAIIGVGAGPITNIFTKKEIIRICNYASVITVRDIESKEYLIEYGCLGDKIYVTADVALTLTKDNLPSSSLQTVNSLLKNNYCAFKYGVNIGVDLDSPVYGLQAKLMIDECVKFFNENHEILPVLIVDHNNNNQKKAIEYVKEKIKTKYIIFRYGIDGDIWDMSALLSELDTVVTNKLHVGIVSYALGTSCIAFPYHPKTLRFYKQIQQQDLCIPLLDLSKGQVYSILKNTLIEDWRKNWVGKRHNNYPVLFEKAKLNKVLLKNFLER